MLIAYKWLLFSFLYSLFSGSGSSVSSAEEKEKHPFYVSVTEINHNSKEKSLEISCKIFADDMEATLQQNYKTQVDLSAEKQQAQVNGFIKDYIIKHLKLVADGKGIALQYIGFEKDSEAVYCYFEGVNVAAVKKLDVSNNILQDYTDKQINIVHVIVNGQRQSTKLDAAQVQASFSF